MGSFISFGVLSFWDAFLLQVNLPEVRQVRELVDRAEEWLARLEAARNAEPPPSLKELRQLLHAGAHTAVANLQFAS